MKILYVCTHNRCRSILSEAITQQNGQGILTAISAGSAPAEQPHPLTLKYLEEHGYSIEGLASKSWHDCQLQSEHSCDLAQTPDVVITVCDSANAETCPVWLGDALKLHWGLSDPSKMAEANNSAINKEDADEEIKQQFYQTIAIIEQRVAQLLAIAKLPKEQWQQLLAALAIDED